MNKEALRRERNNFILAWFIAQLNANQFGSKYASIH
jgi:hypothetical protein